MVRLRAMMTLYMLGSIVFVSVGAFLLNHYSLVPVTLTYATIGAILAVAINAFFVARGSRLALNIGILLSLAAIISSISAPAHLAAMEKIFDGGILSVLDVFEILGFYFFPILYVATRFMVSNEKLSASFA